MGFSGPAFIRHVAQRLLQDFAFSSGAGHPTLIGSAKEHPARVQLEKLLPESVGVGTGIIVDSYGAQSKQQDIVIYERMAPRFSYNDTPEATYFPIEGVISAGEVKSQLSKTEIEDAIEKSASVKRLRRHAIRSSGGLGLPPSVSFRNYGSTLAFDGTPGEEFNQDTKSLDQVFTFVLCDVFSQSPETTLHNAKDIIFQSDIALAPNLFASLRNGLILPYKSHTHSTCRALFEADSLVYCGQPEETFAYLLKILRTYVRAGRTVPYSLYDRYFQDDSGRSGLDVTLKQPLR